MINAIYIHIYIYIYIYIYIMTIYIYIFNFCRDMKWMSATAIGIGVCLRYAWDEMRDSTDLKEQWVVSFHCSFVCHSSQYYHNICWMMLIFRFPKEITLLSISNMHASLFFLSILLCLVWEHNNSILFKR